MLRILDNFGTDPHRGPLWSPEKRLDIAGVQVEGPGAVSYALVCLLLFGGHGGAVKVQLGVRTLVVRVNLQRLTKINKKSS